MNHGGHGRARKQKNNSADSAIGRATKARSDRPGVADTADIADTESHNGFHRKSLRNVPGGSTFCHGVSRFILV